MILNDYRNPWSEASGWSCGKRYKVRNTQRVETVKCAASTDADLVGTSCLEGIGKAGSVAKFAPETTKDEYFYLYFIPTLSDE